MKSTRACRPTKIGNSNETIRGGETRLFNNLLAAVYGRDGEHGDKSTIRILIKQLRTKLQDAYTNPRYVMTEPGYGYRLNMTPAAINAMDNAV